MTAFYELNGAGARRALEAFAAELAALDACLDCRLLESAQQPGLYLLMSEWREEAAPPTPPEGAKVWLFRAA